jgi:hypothetical protein
MVTTGKVKTMNTWQELDEETLCRAAAGEAVFCEAAYLTQAA